MPRDRPGACEAKPSALGCTTKILAKAGGDDALVALMAETRAAMDATGLEPQKLEIFDVARRGGLEDAHRSFYAGLSTDASHPGLIALNSLWEKQGKRLGFAVGTRLLSR